MIGRSRCAADLSATVYCVRGGCIGEDNFRRGAIRHAVRIRAREAVIMAGGKDFARPELTVRRWITQLEELAASQGSTDRGTLNTPSPRTTLRRDNVLARR